MIYISKGVVCKGSTEQRLVIAHSGREFVLTKTEAAIWINGQFGFSEASEEWALRHLSQMGLCEYENESTPTSKYRILSRSICCAASGAKSHLRLTDTERTILNAYKAQLLLMDSALKKSISESVENPLEVCRADQVAVEKDLKAYDEKSLSLYVQYRSGSITKEEFLQKKAELQQQKEALQTHLAELQAKEQGLVEKQMESAHELVIMKEASDKLSESNERLREQMYDDIEKVIVFANMEVDIRWSFAVDFPLGIEN